MLGDWVLYEHKNTEWETESTHYLRVENITSRDICMRNGDYARVQCVGYGCIKPIPLTAEILEKNGFKYDELPKFAVNEITEKTKMTFSYHSGSRTVFVGVNEPNFNLTSACVLYVHELQHILRLSRVEKEIIL